MKKHSISSSFLVVVVAMTLCFSSKSYSQGVGINVDGANPDASSGLDIDFSNKGILIPRLTIAERDAISSPADGLMIYNIDCKSFSYFNGTIWIPLNSVAGNAPSTPGSISGVTTTCASTTGVSYSISSVSGATGYTWTVPGGSAVASGQGSNSITVDFGTTGGTICVNASNSCGTSDISCASITVNTAPSTPVATAATNIDATDFDANWNSSTGATTYYLDVDDNSDFSSPLAGYNNLNVGNVVSYNITGLTCATTYYYRVRASTTCGTSSNSNVISALTVCPPVYPGGSVHCISGGAVIQEVTSGTGRVWMDRNMGASAVGVHGDLYQWGRPTDGHQCRTSGTTTTLSGTDVPGHANHILDPAPSDWRNPSNDNLWQGVSGINNPCPSGYRIPTQSEMEAERLSWSSSNSAGAQSAPLKWTRCGYRSGFDGTLGQVGSIGYYWSSTVGSGALSGQSNTMSFSVSGAFTTDFNYRTWGQGVRCIKD